MKSIVLAAVVLTAPLLTTADEPAEREIVPASENAALRYWQAAWQLARHDLPTQQMFIDFDEIGSEQSNAKLAIAQEEIELLLDATQFDRCDFGVPKDWATGEYLPHLTMARQGAQTLLWDAERLVSLGEFDEAARRITGTFRISEHLAQNVQHTDGSLVSLAISSMAYRFIKKHEGDFDDPQREDIASAIRRFRDSDPFRYTDAFIGEGAASMRWWTNLCDSTDFRNQHPEAVAAVEERFGVQASIEQLNEAFRDYQHFCNEVAKAWNSDTADEAIERLISEADNGHFGLVAATLHQSVAAHRRQDRIANAQLATLRAWANAETETLELPEEEN